MLRERPPAYLPSAICYRRLGHLASARQRRRPAPTAPRCRHAAGAFAGQGPFKGALQHYGHSREAMLAQPVHTVILADAEAAYKIRQDLKKSLSLET